MQAVDISFLIAPGRFAARIPDELDPTPDASTVILYAGGARELGYVPRSRFDVDAVFTLWRHRFDATVDRTTVSVFERPESPPTLSAVWHLPNGYLETWVDEERATISDLETVIRNVTVVERSPVPKVRLSGPIQRAATRESGDTVGFYAASKTEGLVVRFVEDPKHGRSAATAPFRTTAWSETRAAAAAGVRVVCGGPLEREPELRDIADAIADSVQVK